MARSVVFLYFCLQIFWISVQIPHGLGSGIATRQIERSDETPDRVVARIYDVLEFHDMQLSESRIWKLARILQEESDKHALDPTLVLAIIKVESEFDHRAVSPRGARGLMQIQPRTAAAVAKDIEIPSTNIAMTLQNPIANIRIGTTYLSQLRHLFRDLKLMLIAYNWGPTWLKRRLTSGMVLPRAYPDRVMVARQYLERRWNFARSSTGPHESLLSEKS